MHVNNINPSFTGCLVKVQKKTCETGGEKYIDASQIVDISAREAFNRITYVDYDVADLSEPQIKKSYKTIISHTPWALEKINEAKNGVGGILDLTSLV